MFSAIWKSKKSLSLILIFLFFLINAFAQEGEEVLLKGKVTDAVSHEPLIGAIIAIKGTNDGTAADAEGNYEIRTKQPVPFSLVVNYAGYAEKELEVYESNSALDVSLVLTNTLSEVVVTAVGIESSRKSINYSLAEVKGKELVQARETNLTTALTGKVSGVQIGNSGGSPGGSSTIRIRGNTSVLGNNSPLFVLDGIPIDNTIQDLLPNITNSVSLATPSNRAIDINQDDIASMTILKGPAAAALYGLRAANGAVIINTKRGSKLGNRKAVLSFSSSLTFDQINRRLQPRQHRYSNGYEGKYILPGQPGSDENWGSLLDTLTYSSQPSQFDKNGRIVGVHDPLSNGIPINRYDNEDKFFQTGITQNYNLGISGKIDKAGYYLSAGRLYQTGIVPTTDFYRTTIRFNGDLEITEKLKTEVGINFINSGSNNSSLNGGYGTNAIRALRNSPDNFDITNGLEKPWDHPESYKLAPTNDRPWGGSRAYAGGNGWDNPYWSLNMNPQKNDVNRFLGYNQFEYSITSWLKSTFRYGIDSYRDLRNSGFSRGSNGVGAGVVNVINFYRKDFNSDFILTADKKINEDIGITINLGHNFYNSYRYQSNTRGDALLVPGLFNFANASTTSSFESTIKKKLVAIFGSASIAYKEWLFLNITGRNEWSSALPKENSSFFYPSVGTSFIFTNALGIKSELLSFGKVRATFAKVGNDVDPYSLETYYNGITITNNSLQSALQTPFAGNPGLELGNKFNDLANVLGNKKLKPESITSWEVGSELRFFKDRVSLDATYYQTLSRNQIIPVSLPASTGYAASIENSGEVSNKGIELTLDATIVQKKDFQWDAGLIYYKNVNRVEALAEGLSSLSLGGVFADSRAIVGQPYGILVGTDLLRNAEGKPIIDDRITINEKPNPNYGYAIVNPKPTQLADPNPKFNAGLRNTFRYKFVSLSFLLDTRYGFAIMNAPKLQMVFNGVDISTENRDEPLILDGVKLSDGTRNNVAIAPDNNAGSYRQQAWYRSTFNIPGMYVEKDLYWLKLRDVNLSFALPSRWLKPLSISAASLTFTARNIILKTNYSGSDPDLSSRNGLQNALGADFWTVPNTRSYGTSLNITF